MNYIPSLFKKNDKLGKEKGKEKGKGKEKEKEKENDCFDNTRTFTEINKLLYNLDDELHNLNLSAEKKMKIMKNYKVNLDNDNIPSLGIFEKKLVKANMPIEHIEQLKQLYQTQLTNRIILKMKICLIHYYFSPN